MHPQSNYDRAVCRVEQKIRFFVHLGIYTLVNGLLVTVNLIKTPQNLWFYWPLCGWGIGIVLHAWRVFSSSELSGFRQRMIEREMKKQSGPETTFSENPSTTSPESNTSKKP